MAKFCENCGSPLIPGTKFCTECGYKLPADAAPANPSPAPPTIHSGASPIIPNSAPPTIPNSAPPTIPNGIPPTIQSGSPPIFPNGAEHEDSIRRGLPQYRMPEQKRPAQAAGTVPQMQAPVQRSPQQPQRPMPSRSKGSTGLAVFLSVLMLAEAAFAGFKYPGWFRKKDGGSGSEHSLTDSSSGNNKTEYHLDPQFAELMQPIFDRLGMTAADYEEYMQDPIEATADNSPGNPEFVELSFSEAEYAAAKTLSAPVSAENPSADFPEFGIHAELKRWNLEHDTDTLIVKQLPTKTDPSTGAVCYTYDYSLASGQSRFPTNVDITVPVQGDPQGLANVITIDPDTGKWTELYFTMSEDGSSYTFSTDHFSPGTEMSFEEGKEAISYYTYQDGKSIFNQLSREGVPKYEETSHYLYNVGIVNTPNFEKYLDHDTKHASETLQDIMQKNGGEIPADVAMEQAGTSFGDQVDCASYFSTLTSFLELKDEVKNANEAFGGILTAVGIVLLAIRVSGQLNRGVEWTKIINDPANVWAALGAAIGVASAFTLCSVPAALSFLSLFLYHVTKAHEKYLEVQKRSAFRDPRTVEEGAFQYFITEYGKNALYNQSFALPNRAYDKIANNSDAMADVATFVYNTSVFGDGWATQLNLLYEKYEKDPAMLGAIIEAAYEWVVDRYWHQSPEIVEACWKESVKRIMDSGYYYTYADTGMIFTDYEKEAESLGITLSEFKRRAEITYQIDKMGKTVDEVVAEWKTGKYQYSPDEAEIRSYKDRALALIYENTTDILYSVSYTQYQKGIKDAREKIYKEILPWMNTRITFYWRDPAVKSGSMSKDSAYYQFLYNSSADRYTFAFDCDTNSTLFLPGNRDSMVYQMFLMPNKSNNVLLETTLYNYLMWRCPKDVLVFRTKEGVNDPDLVSASANFEGVRLKADPNSCINGNDFINIPPQRRNIEDIKVPVVPGSQPAGSLEQYLGTWESSSGDRQYRVVFRPQDSDGTKIEFIADVKTKDDAQFKSYAKYSLSQKKLGQVYTFYGKSLLISESQSDGVLDGNHWRFRFTRKGRNLVLEEWLYTSNELLDSTKEIQAFELYPSSADSGRYNDLTLQLDTMLCACGRQAVLSEALQKQFPTGGSAVIGADGTISITVPAATLTTEIKQDDLEYMKLESKREAVRITGKIESDNGTTKQYRFDSIPNYTVSQTITAATSDQSGSAHGVNRLEDIKAEESRIYVSYSDTGKLQAIQIQIVADIESTFDYGSGKPDVMRFGFGSRVPVQFLLIPE